MPVRGRGAVQPPRFPDVSDRRADGRGHAGRRSERELTTDVDALLERVSERTRLVFIANPNNPTGTYLSASEVTRLHAGLPPSVVLAIDAAYAEFANRNDYEPGVALVDRADNVVMLRTFSKIYALAGLRLGWAYCPPTIADVLNRMRGLSTWPHPHSPPVWPRSRLSSDRRAPPRARNRCGWRTRHRRRRSRARPRVAARRAAASLTRTEVSSGRVVRVGDEYQRVRSLTRSRSASTSVVSSRSGAATGVAPTVCAPIGYIRKPWRLYSTSSPDRHRSAATG